MASRDENVAAVQRYFDGFAVEDVEQMLSAWVDDCVYVERFSEPPRRIEGKDNLRPYFSKAFDFFEMRLEITAVHECVEPDKLILEYSSTGTMLTTGRPYANSYIGIYWFRDGQIWQVNEFHNPMITERARQPM
jgi:uncharacterized protein